MSRVRGSLEIARPVEEVFDYVADQRNEPRFNPAMTASAKLDDGPIGVGTRFQATVLSRGKPLAVTIEYTGFDRPHRIVSRSVMDGSTAEGQVQCEPTPRGTRFSWDWTVRVEGPARFAGPLIGVIGRRQERVIWTGLKDHLEGRRAWARQRPPDNLLSG
ncbi:MAG TPA: SRPBCC family protein [Actinotalea sp.]